MSSMNFLKKLLDGAQVEWKALKDLTLPTSNIKWREANRSYRYIDLTSVSIENKSITETIEITSSDAPSRAQKIVEKDDVIFATTRPTQKRYCLIGDKYSGEIASTGYCVLRAKQSVISPKWILHWVASSDFNKYLEENQSGSAYPAISDAKVKEFKIPIPCPGNPKKSLEIQAEIVRILDTLTAHTAELTAELTARKKQYEYYETKLIFNRNFDLIPLGEVCTVNQGLQIPISERKTEDGKNRYFYITVQFLKGSEERYFIESPLESVICDYDDVLVTRTGSTGKIITGVRGCFHNNFFKVNCSEKLLKRYMYYLLRSKVMFTKLLSAASGGTVPDLPHNKFYKISVPVPPLAEQAHIVAILDKFDALTHSITEGLPREIELRQKQYAYYRDLLLSFPKPQEA